MRFPLLGQVVAQELTSMEKAIPSMKQTYVLWGLALLALASACAETEPKQDSTESSRIAKPFQPNTYTPESTFQLTSSSKGFRNSGTVGLRQICNRNHQKTNWAAKGGKNRSPQVSWSNPPAATQYFILLLEGRSSSGAKRFFQWGLLNLPANTRGFAENADANLNPSSVEKVNRRDFAKGACGTWAACLPLSRYVGPCAEDPASGLLGSNPNFDYNTIYFTYTLRVLAIDRRFQATRALANQEYTYRQYEQDHLDMLNRGMRVLGEGRLAATLKWGDY